MVPIRFEQVVSKILRDMTCRILDLTAVNYWGHQLSTLLSRPHLQAHSAECSLAHHLSPPRRAAALVDLFHCVLELMSIEDDRIATLDQRAVRVASVAPGKRCVRTQVDVDDPWTPMTESQRERGRRREGASERGAGIIMDHQRVCSTALPSHIRGGRDRGLDASQEHCFPRTAAPTPC